MSMQSAARSDAAPEGELFHSGESLVIVEIRASDRSVANRIASAFADRIASAGLPFVYDIVPAMTTVGVHYAPQRVPLDAPEALPHRVVAERLGALLAAASRVIDIPVCYGGEHGPDLDEVANACGVSAADVMLLGFGFVAYAVLVVPVMLLMNRHDPLLAFVALLVVALPMPVVQSVGYPAYAEQFPTRVRYTGMAFSFNFGAILGGGVTPYIATAIIGATGNLLSPACMLAGAAVIGLLTLASLRETADETLA